MAHPHNHLAPGAMPVIGRMFEAAAAQQLAASGDTGAPRGLPFVGEVAAFQPGVSITVGRRLALEEDLFLADHNFVHAPGVKPLAECFPVVPMTASLEIMADTAACLAPGYGLIGFEDVTARRWIAVADGGELALRIEGRLAHHDAEQGRSRIAVQVFAGAGRDAAIEATVLFGAHHDGAPQPRVAPVAAGVTLDAAQLYAARQLFHGPRFQGLHGAIHIGSHGARAELLVRPAQDWFASQQVPQLLTDPALLDGVGQLIAVWCLQQGCAAFPIGVGQLELFGPTPAPGTLVPLRLDIAGRQLKMLSADVEIGDGAGGVWIRITGWKSWQFNWAPELVAFQRQPAHYLLSDTQALPGACAASACQRVAAQRVAGFELDLLARHYLHASEMAEFAGKAALPQRQLEWLLGRIAAKDAARAWSARDSGAGPQLHPAAFGIANDAAGQPSLTHWPAALARPCISIAHSEGQAIALAAATPAGIDIERIAVRDEYFLASFSSAAERQLLAGWSGPERDAWITRLWCAKEALGKRLGTGVDSAPRNFQAQSLAPDDSLRMRHGISGVEAHIVTFQDGDFIIAIDHPAASY